jgi:hypothetical protein
MSENDRLRQKYMRVLPHLNERQRRLVGAADATAVKVEQWRKWRF